MFYRSAYFAVNDHHQFVVIQKEKKMLKMFEFYSLFMIIMICS